MKYILLLFFISCKPILIDKYDYIVVLRDNLFTCDYKNSEKSYKRCKNILGLRIEEVVFTDGYVLTIRE